MNISDIDLATLRSPLEDSLRVYEPLLGAKFDNFPPFFLTPEKANSARTTIQVAGFLTITDERNPILENVRFWKRPAPYS